jgi:hypothetical protein
VDEIFDEAAAATMGLKLGGYLFFIFSFPYISIQSYTYHVSLSIWIHTNNVNQVFFSFSFPYISIQSYTYHISLLSIISGYTNDVNQGLCNDT